MTLQLYEYESGGVARNRLLECSACGYEFAEHERRWVHFFEDHAPEDFGLDPLGVVSDGHDRPLFDSDPGRPVAADGGHPGGDDA